MTGETGQVLAHDPVVIDGGEANVPGTGPRPMRADAVKNRRRILEAAETVFASEGVSVPIDLVAERAGVGIGTLYRHFPTKETLFEAIVMARLADLLDAAQESIDSEEPGEALFSFLRQFAHQAAAKRDLFDAMVSAGIDIKSQCATTIEDMKRRLDTLVHQAKDVGALRLDVSTDEVMGLVIGASQALGHAGDDLVNLDRMIDIVCDGLRASGSTGPR